MMQWLKALKKFYFKLKQWRNRVMTQEDKELLLKDLSARLLNGVFCKLEGVERSQKLTKIDIDDFGETSFSFSWKNNKGSHKNEYVCSLGQIKPYLRSMDDMTEEEYKIYHELVGGMFGTGILINLPILEDFLNKNHFDYRGLIEKGLAIKVTEENNPYKE